MLRWCLILHFILTFTNSSAGNIDIFFQNVSAYDKSLLSPACREDLDRVPVSSESFLLMVDASSKIPAGLAKGNIISLGNFDECLEIEKVSTKFCHAAVNIELPFEKITPEVKKINTEIIGVQQKSINVSIGWYICTIRSCNASELNLIFNGLLRFNDEQCSTNESKQLDPLAITAIVIFTLIGLITLISTGYDLYLLYTLSEPIHPIFIAFSVYSNGKKLFKLEKNNQQLQCLHGIKSLSMMWVVIGHVFAFYLMVPLDNYLDVYKWLDSAHSQYITGATVSVDTFFVVGGFLTMYTFQGAMDKGTKFNVPLYYFHRYLRLTPAFAAVILAHAALFNYLGDGPIWQNTDTYLVSACRQYWWSALLYVQNFSNPLGICVPQSWYLSVDMQLFLISPLFLVVMRKSALWGNVLLGVASALSIIASFVIGWTLNLNGQMTGNGNGQLEDYMTYYYGQIYTRMAPYLFGIVLGYYIYDWKQNKKTFQLRTSVVVTVWIISLVLMGVCIYAGHTLQFTAYNHAANAFFIALMRPVWGLTICWVIFACCMGNGGAINTFLSLPIFQIFSRLSYSIYLVHYALIQLNIYKSRETFHFGDELAFHKFLGDFIYSTVIAVIWTLLFESPIIILEKILLTRKRVSSEHKKSSITQQDKATYA